MAKIYSFKTRKPVPTDMLDTLGAPVLHSPYFDRPVPVIPPPPGEMEQRLASIRRSLDRINAMMAEIRTPPKGPA